MGTWSVSVTGNDTAADLRTEYTVAFFKYDVEEALEKIEAYVRAEGFSESDEEEWCNYVYSLADFMWKKGILTDAVRDRAISMIDSGFGLELWAEEGEKTLAARKKKLAEFREKLLSPKPPKKKIKPNVYLEPIFTPGDLVAIRLQTAGKPYTCDDDRPMTDEEFHAFDGKYILIQLVECHAGWTSHLDPSIKDYWADFRLYDGVFDDVPYDLDPATLPIVKFVELNEKTSVFTCESSMFYFKKRDYKIIGNRPDLVQHAKQGTRSYGIYLSINNERINPDSEFLAAMDKQVSCGLFSGTDEQLHTICYYANRYGRYNLSLSREENDRFFEQQASVILANINKTVSSGGRLYSIKLGRKEIGVVTVAGRQIDHLYIEGRFQRLGYGTELLRHVLTVAGKGAYVDVLAHNTAILKLCEAVGLKRQESLLSRLLRKECGDEIIRMVK